MKPLDITSCSCRDALSDGIESKVRAKLPTGDKPVGACDSTRYLVLEALYDKDVGGASSSPEFTVSAFQNKISNLVHKSVLDEKSVYIIPKKEGSRYFYLDNLLNFLSQIDFSQHLKRSHRF